MVKHCSVKECKSKFSSGKNIGFFRIPRVVKNQGEKTEALSKERNRKWLQCLNLGPESYSEHMRICSKHFLSGVPSALYDTANPDWLPSRYLREELANLKDESEKISNVQCYERKRKHSSVIKDQLKSTKMVENEDITCIEGEAEGDQINLDKLTNASLRKYERDNSKDNRNSTRTEKRKMEQNHLSNKTLQNENIFTPSQSADEISDCDKSETTFIKMEICEDLDYESNDFITPDHDYETLNDATKIPEIMTDLQNECDHENFGPIDLPVINNDMQIIYLPVINDREINEMVEFPNIDGNEVRAIDPFSVKNNVVSNIKTKKSQEFTNSSDDHSCGHTYSKIIKSKFQQKLKCSGQKHVDANLQMDILPVFQKENNDAMRNNILPTSKNIQTNLTLNCIDRSAQTLFRVCETFELESSQLKLKEAQYTIKEMNSQLSEANSEIQSLREELSNSKSKLGNIEKLLNKRQYSKSYFDCDEKVKYFTGLLTFQMLEKLCQEAEPYLPKKSIISPFQQCALTLMKLKMAVSNRDLAYRFDISETTVGRLFYSCLNVFYQHFTSYIVWPERESLWSTMPLIFKNTFNNKFPVIVDCFEVLVEKPSNISVQKQSGLGNTVKFIIGITPQGNICFVSKGYVEHLSDNLLTEKSGLLDKLLPGDIILAGRGFNIDKSFGLFSASVENENFSKQLKPHDKEITKTFLNLRMHVDRIIRQTLQRFTIVHSRIPSEFLHIGSDDSMTPLSKIFMAVCALSNLCQSVVKENK